MDSSIAEALVQAGRALHAMGWVPATSGNLSARLDAGTIAITVSGRHKGRLDTADIMTIDLQGRALDGRTPSAEALLHARLYARHADIGAVLHPHSPAATALSRARRGQVALRDYELLKALPKVRSHAVTVSIPVFENSQDMPWLADAVDAWLDQHPDCPAYLIAGHGLYTWGRGIDEALRHVEALEFLFGQEILAAGMSHS